MMPRASLCLPRPGGLRSPDPRRLLPFPITPHHLSNHPRLVGARVQRAQTKSNETEEEEEEEEDFSADIALVPVARLPSFAEPSEAGGGTDFNARENRRQKKARSSVLSLGVIQKIGMQVQLWLAVITRAVVDNIHTARASERSFSLSASTSTVLSTILSHARFFLLLFDRAAVHAALPPSSSSTPVASRARVFNLVLSSSLLSVRRARCVYAIHPTTCPGPYVQLDDNR